MFDIEKVLKDVNFLLERKEYRRCLEILEEAVQQHPNQPDLHQFVIKAAGPLGLSQRICTAFLDMAKIFEERGDVHTAAACFMEAKRFNPSVQSTMRIKKLVERVHGPKISPDLMQAKTEEAERTDLPSMECDLAVVHWVDIAQVLAVKRLTGVLVISAGDVSTELGVDYGYLVSIRNPTPPAPGRDNVISELKGLYSLVEGNCRFFLKQEVTKDFSEESIEGLLMDVAAALDEDNRDGGWGWADDDEEETETKPDEAPATMTGAVDSKAASPAPAGGFFFGEEPVTAGGIPVTGDILEI